MGGSFLQDENTAAKLYVLIFLRKGRSFFVYFLLFVIFLNYKPKKNDALLRKVMVINKSSCIAGTVTPYSTAYSPFLVVKDD